MGWGNSKLPQNAITPQEKSHHGFSTRASTGKIHSNSIFDDYKIGTTLGQGAFAEVRKVEHILSRLPRACKIYMKQGLQNWQTDTKFLLSEAKVLSALDHPNILKAYDIYQDHRRYFVVMEFWEGGELFDKLSSRGRFNETDAAKIMFQLLSAIAYWHQRKVIHRDLKPENILLTAKGNDLDIKVADFGCSCFLDVNRKLSGVFGSAYYIAPEVLKGQYNEKCDLWSWGVIMYILLSGRAPFGGKDDKAISEAILAGTSVDFPKKYFAKISQSAQDLVKQLLTYTYKDRISAVNALNHEWIESYNSANPPSQEVIQNVLENIVSFNSSAKLKDAIHAFIATHMIANKETKDLKDAFLSMDMNKDGKLDRNEMLSIYKKKIGNEEQAIKKVEEIMGKVDTDQSGFIDYTEFITASLDSRVLLSKENLKVTFAMFDKDGSGTISASELNEMLGDADLTHSHIWREIVTEVDQNGDGEIDLKEFESVLLNRL